MTDIRRRRTREEQRAETRARLLDAAAEVFAAQGFTGSSIDEITERAGYTRGAFYSNFADKADLLVQLSEARMDAFAATMLPRISAIDVEDGIGEVARWIVDQPPAVEIPLLIELVRQSEDHPEVAEVLERFSTRLLGFIDRMLDAATTLRPEAAERDALSTALLASIAGMQMTRLLGIGGDVRAAELLLRGVLSAGGALPDEGAELGPASTKGTA